MPIWVIGIAAVVDDQAIVPRRSGTVRLSNSQNVVALDSGAGLANATLQQRLVPVRLFYDFLVEEGLRESNPVGRGAYAPGRVMLAWQVGVLRVG